MAATSDERNEIAFFDVETTFPTTQGQRSAILEFGAILVCPRTLVDLQSYSTLVRPSDPALVSSLSDRYSGISRDALLSAPSFLDIADAVFGILHGRIWAGHNILKFDCARIREAFAEIGRPPPEPKGIIDSFVLLTQKFRRRAGNMKMPTLAKYFGLGRQSHRSLDDVRMNLEVLKCCATVLFLESTLPDILTKNSNGAVLPSNFQINVENRPIASLVAQSGGEVPNLVEANTSRNVAQLGAEITADSQQADVNMEDNSIPELPDVSSTPAIHQTDDSSVKFLAPEEVFIPSISAFNVPFNRGTEKIKLMHGDDSLQLRCTRLQVRFGISTKFVGQDGRPRLSFVVDASPSLCRVLDSCDDIARMLFTDSDSTSEWKHVVSRRPRFVNYPTIRLQIPTEVCEEIVTYAAEIYQKDISGSVQRLVFSKFDPSELSNLFNPGTFVDAFFLFDYYDYLQKAGLRLVAKKLIIRMD